MRAKVASRVPPRLEGDCLLDKLAADVRPPPFLGQRYLVYAPQFGLSNQLVSLRNAVIWSLLLNRTLVLPHLLGHATADVMVAHGAVFDTSQAVRSVAPLQLIEIEGFLRLGIRPTQVLELITKTKYSVASDSYFRALGPRWRPIGQRALVVPLHDFSAQAIVASFGGCSNHQAIAFQSLFAAFDVSCFIETGGSSLVRHLGGAQPTGRVEG